MLEYIKRGITMNDSIIKNRYCIIEENNEVYAYISIKKDFYVEGVLAKDKTLITGYFSLYDEIGLLIWKDNIKYGESNGISIKSDSNMSTINDNFMKNDYRLYEARIDAYGGIFDRKEISNSIKLSYVTDKTIIKDIDYYIRESKKNLDSAIKKYLSFFEHNRIETLRELLNDIKWLKSKHPDFDTINEKDFEELSNYLKVLKEKNKQEDTNDKNKTKIKKVKKERK